MADTKVKTATKTTSNAKPAASANGKAGKNGVAALAVPTVKQPDPVLAGDGQSRERQRKRSNKCQLDQPTRVSERNLFALVRANAAHAEV